MNEDDDVKDEPEADAPEGEDHEARAKGLEAELARVRKKNRELEGRIEESKKESKPDSEDKVTLDDGSTVTKSQFDELSQGFAEIRKTQAVRDLRDGLSISGEQAQAVHDLMDKMTDLKPVEALSIARARNAELFGDKDANAYDPAVHGSMRPTAGGEPVADSEREKRAARIEEIHKAPDKFTRDEMAAKLTGEAAARALGLQPGKRT